MENIHDYILKVCQSSKANMQHVTVLVSKKKDTFSKDKDLTQIAFEFESMDNSWVQIV